ncbi:sensor histidine kinase [Fodinibius sp. AD559]|uniref:sensor histidine kinase n=1 Tax=Fodinibius sp. AD559 TaxID=3424179 RepID=UPI004046D88B
MNIRSWSIYILLTVSIVLTILTGMLLYYGEVEETQDTRNLLDTHEVIHSANQLYTILLDAETGQRGYLITGNQNYLEPYKNATEHIDHRLERLTTLVDEKSDQQHVINNELEPAIDRKLAELKETIALFNNQGGEEAVALTNTHFGREQMDAIRNALDKIIAQEEQLLEQRGKQLDQSSLLFNLISYGGLFFITVTIVMALITIRQKNRENQKLIDQLEKSNGMLSDLHEREVQLSNEKSKFMSMAAHDLRSPINAIMSIANLIKNDQDQLNEEQKEYLDYISESANKMSNMIDNFLDVQKIEEGENNTTQPENVNVYGLLKAILMGFKPKASSKNITLNLKSDCKDKPFCTDKAMFSQVAENLISNAIKYSPSDTTVTVSLSKADNKKGFRMSVSDQGLGIKEEEQEQIFEPYAGISNKPTGDEPSTGLGLSIVKIRIDAMGGSIECDSQPNKGTTFTTYFPPLECDETTD